MTWSNCGSSSRPSAHPLVFHPPIKLMSTFSDHAVAAWGWGRSVARGIARCREFEREATEHSPSSPGSGGSPMSLWQSGRTNQSPMGSLARTRKLLHDSAATAEDSQKLQILVCIRYRPSALVWSSARRWQARAGAGSTWKVHIYTSANYASSRPIQYDANGHGTERPPFRRSSRPSSASSAEPWRSTAGTRARANARRRSS